MGSIFVYHVNGDNKNLINARITTCSYSSIKLRGIKDIFERGVGDFHQSWSMIVEGKYPLYSTYDEWLVKTNFCRLIQKYML